MSEKKKQKSITVFCCYAHEDEDLLKKLKGHLSPLQHQGLITVWYDRNISAGATWQEEIKRHLSEAQIILLLISPDFMSSQYCYGVEMQHALERHENGTATVIPVILRHTYWYEGRLGTLQALPTDGKPVTSRVWDSQDEAFYMIALGIRSIVKTLIAEKAETLNGIGLQNKNADSSLDDEAILKALAAHLDGQFVGRDKRDVLVAIVALNCEVNDKYADLLITKLEHNGFLVHVSSDRYELTQKARSKIFRGGRYA